MIKDFTTYINEGLFDRNQSEFNIRKTDKGVEQIYIPKTKEDLYKYIELDIEQAKKEGTYPDVNLNNIDVSGLRDDELNDWNSVRIFKTIREWHHIIPDISSWNIKYIPNSFFDGNEQVEEYTIPNGFTSIRSYAFHDCSGLKSITIPNSVTSIESYAFKFCSNLTSVTIPDSVTIIEEGAFCGCTNLASVTISKTITNIRNCTFSGCDSLTSVTIPDGVTNIGEVAFLDCSSLTSLTIPDSVTNIENQAFSGCHGLKSITIPNSVTNIGYRTFCDSFENYSGLTYVSIPKHCHINGMSFPKKCEITRRDD